MDKNIFNKIVNSIKLTLRDSDKLLQKCIAEEEKYGNSIEKAKIFEVIDEYKDSSQFDKEGLKLGIIYSGNYQITIKYILDSILHENKIVLSNLLCEDFTSFIVSLFDAVLKDLKVDNPVIKYNCSEQELIQEEGIDSIIYIGDLFNYNSFRGRYRRNSTLKYNSYDEYIKLLLDVNKKENRGIYAKIFAYCYKANIIIERYNTFEELQEDNLETDYIVAYVNEEDKQRCLESLKYETILFNTFPFDNYKFNVVK